MDRKRGNSRGTLRTTALGGVLFLLPIVVIGVLLSYVYRVAAAAYLYVKPWLPFDSVISIANLFCLLTVLLLVACFVAGLFAQRAIGRFLTRTIEQQLIKVYPKYAIYKDLLAGKLGGDENVPSLRPVSVWKEGVVYLAFEADRLANGLVVVYFPGAPDAWYGSIALVAPEHVQPIDVPFDQLLNICERLGRDSSRLLSALRLNQLSVPMRRSAE
jgi:uncharacterized membrane protein